MKLIDPESYLPVCMLLRQEGLYVMPIGPVSNKEDEITCIHQVLSNKDTNNYQYHIFELAIPNPVYVVDHR